MRSASLRTSRGYESPLLRGVTGTAIRPGGLALTARAVAFCRFPPGARLLDVGCGAGATVEHLRTRYGFAAAGIDPSRSLVAEGVVRNPALPLAEGMAETLPVEDGVLDGILCECVFSLVEEPLRALSEFHRGLRPGGHLILSDMYDRGREGREQMEAQLSQGGFTVIYWEDHTPLLKELAARLILAGGTPEEFCCSTCAGGRPGYYLVIARKA
jgi:arsenite methyltransferase